MNRILVPVAVLEGETVAPGLMNLLGTVDVTVLGYHVVPEQTAPDQARIQYEERAMSALEDITQEFQQAGGDADYRLVFTHDRQKTIQRVADETNVRGIATTGATGEVDRILVSLTGDVAVERILTLVAELIGDRDIGVTLFVAGEEPEDVRHLLDESAARLADAGIDVQTEIASGSPFDALIDAAPGHDAIVVEEKAPSVTSLLFGEEPERIASASVGPAIVVRDSESLDS